MEDKTRQTSARSFESNDSIYTSLDSVKSSYKNLSKCLSNSNATCSFELTDIQHKNKQMLEIVTAKLTTLVYFNRLSLVTPHHSAKPSAEESEDIKELITSTLKQSQTASPNIFEAKKILKHIENLEKVLKAEEKKLEHKKIQVCILEEEESNLKAKLTNVEFGLSKTLFGTSPTKLLCDCRVF